MFPNGIESYLYGGVLLGISVTFLYLLTGYIMGANAVFEGVVSYFTKIVSPKFRSLRLTLFVGIVSGALLYTLLFDTFWQTTVQWWRLILGGFLIGLGATMGKGCTSGHGICGLASLSKSSITYVATFMIIAFITAFILQTLGVFP